MDIYGEFIPRILFLWSIFGYLCFMILFKWGTNYPAQNILNIEWKQANNITNVRGPYPGTGDAPVLLNELIFMVLPGGKPDNLFSGQQKLQYFLVILAILMIPIMCCLKPCHYKHFKSKIVKAKPVEPGNTDQIDSDYQLYHAQNHPEEEAFSEILVHQLLETIEFVLGSVSHTASYLRLWALSLAHSELATVFWDKVVFLLIEYTAQVHWFVVALGTFAAFSIWFFITFLVMLFMEGLSAFLHALRLHWVEFQSKFYKGDGHEFQPFSFSQIGYTNNEQNQ
jgi:V-type H+-transporting ATPase subunit a